MYSKPISTAMTNNQNLLGRKITKKKYMVNIEFCGTTKLENIGKGAL